MIVSSCERQGIKFWVSIKKPVWYDYSGTVSLDVGSLMGYGWPRFTVSTFRGKTYFWGPLQQTGWSSGRTCLPLLTGVGPGPKAILCNDQQLPRDLALVEAGYASAHCSQLYWTNMVIFWGVGGGATGVASVEAAGSFLHIWQSQCYLASEWTHYWPRLDQSGMVGMFLW